MARAWPRLSAAALVAFWAYAAWAQATSSPDPPGGGFRLPVDCRLNEDCWIANYFDVVSGPKEADFRCSSRTYDGHDGTDIALRDRLTMERGVAVLAGAPGVVIATRDGESDGIYVRDGLTAVAGRECGNGVLIDHGSGWSTQFCHMRRGSLSVGKGDHVTATTALGLVGMSGQAAFPHLHWTVRHGDIKLDPFTGRQAAAQCSLLPGAESLWHPADRIGYQPFSLYAVGFATQEPRPADIIADASGPSVLSTASPAFGVWAAILGVRPDDKVTMRVVDPAGGILLEGRYAVDRALALQVPYLGRPRRGDRKWQAGRYHAEVTVERLIDGRLVRQSRDGSVDLR